MSESIHLPEQKERICYTVTELGKLTGLSVRTWWRLVREGAVPTVRVGERVLVPHAAVMEFIAKRLDKTGAAATAAGAHPKKTGEGTARRRGVGQMGTPSTLPDAVRWLQDEASRLQYGLVAVEIIVHAGRITRVVSRREVSQAAPTEPRRNDNDGPR